MEVGVQNGQAITTVLGGQGLGIDLMDCDFTNRAYVTKAS